MNRIILTLAVLSAWLAGPALAADGDSCKFVNTAVTPGTAASSANIPLPTATCSTFQGGAGAVGLGCATTNAIPDITCRLIADKTAPGAFTAGPMWVPGGGQNIDEAVIRVLTGDQAGAGCGYDDVNVYELSNYSTANDEELPSIGLLDDDGSSSGVKQIKVFGPIGPYIYLSGTATAVGACDATHHLQIQLLLYNKKPQ